MFSGNQRNSLVVRWRNLFDPRQSVDKLKKNVTNLELFFQDEILNAESYESVDKLLSQLEKYDAHFKKYYYEVEVRKEEVESVKKIRNEMLYKTDWSMVADAPLSNEGRKKYREYRQYLRDLPELWENKQALDLEVMTFDEWLKKPPTYKVQRKEIL